MPYPGLRFTDGTTTVTVSDGSTGWLLEYEAKNKLASEPEVTEQCTFLALGTLSTIRGNIESLNRIFQAARIFNTERIGSRCYVERQTESGGTWWRSPIIDALPVLGPDALDFELVNSKLSVNVIFTRANYWEGAEATLELTNGGGTNVTTGLTVYNHDDSGTGHDNWVSIDAADVTGDLPAPCIIQVKNTYASLTIDTLWVGHSWVDPDDFTHWLEIEAGEQTGTDTSEATCSGSVYTAFSLATATPTRLCAWTISSPSAEAMANQWFRPLIRFRYDTNKGSIATDTATNLPAMWMRFKVSQRTDFSSVLFVSNWFYNTGEGVAVIIPSKSAERGGLLSDYNLELWGKQDTGSTINFGMDFCHLMPVQSWQKIEAAPDSIDQNYYLITDSISEITYWYYIDTDNYYEEIKSVYGKPIFLQPNKKQRLYFIWEGTGSCSHIIDATVQVIVTYRPRKLTLT